MTKICTICNNSKQIIEFFVRDKNTGRRHAQCKTCYKQKRDYSSHYGEYSNEYKIRAIKRKSKLKKENTHHIIEYLKKHPCVSCGETDPIVLDFDHRDPKEKEMCVSRMINNYKWDSILREITKCDVLCANCHRKKTAKQFNHLKHLILN